MKSVYKGSGGFGIVHRHYEHALVEVGGKNVRLLGKVGGAADDVILPVLYLADKGRTFLVQYDVHIIAYVRIVRDHKELTSNIEGIYPCGEGAGYAGGITSAAMDGIKVAEAVASVYSLPVNKM